MVEPGPPPVSRLTMSNILKFSMPRNSTASMMKGSAIGSGDRPELPPGRGAVDLRRLVDVVGDRAQPGEADQHHIGRPHPGIDDDDRPGRQRDVAEHLER